MQETPIGAVLDGKYAIRRLIGRGGMGAVYEGEHLAIGRRVAIKLIDREHSRNEETAARFRREARAAGRVESSHIVHVFDVGNDPQFGVYLVMEFLKGEDLRRKLDRVEKLDPSFAIDFAHQSARGLAKAHAAGVIHRDLKPANIFLCARDDERATVKIVDFGVSKLVSRELTDADKRAITRAGVTMGSPQYMSPEQVQGHEVDGRTDVWALGAVLYEMVAGRPAYPLLDSYEQTVLAIVLQEPPALRTIAPWVPENLVEVIERALEHDIEKRIPDCETFARLLNDISPAPLSRRMVEGEPSDPNHNIRELRDARSSDPEAGHSSEIEQRRVTSPDEKRRTRLRAIVALSLAIPVGVLGIGLLARSQRPRSNEITKSPEAPASTTALPVPSSAPSTVTITLPTTMPSSITITISSGETKAVDKAEKSASPAPSPSPKATAVATAKPEASDNQFGGAGLSSSY